MEVMNMIKILRRWAWLIISIVVLTGLALLLSLQLAKPAYEAQVKIQLSTPQQEDVAIYDAYRSLNIRDMITVARNNFVEILDSSVVHDRTLQALNLDPERVEFELEIDSSSDSDFVFVIIKAPSPSLAASIANTLVDQAMDYYGELRAKPTIEEKELYGEQLKAAEESYRSAADAFTSFKAENNISVLQQEIAIAQRLMEQLQSERDQRILEVNVKDPVGQVNDLITRRQVELDRLLALEPMYLILEENYQEAREQYRLALSPLARDVVRTAAEARYRSAEQAFNEFKVQNNVASLQNEIAINTELLQQLQLELDQRLLADSDKEGLIDQVNGLILQRKQELDRLSSLQPTYYVLEEKTNEAQTKYQHILSKYTEAELKATVVRAANFIQVVEPAYEPLKPVNDLVILLVLGMLGGLGFGVLLAFLLDYMTVTGEEELLPEKPDPRTVLGLPVLGMIPVLEKSLYKIDSSEAENIRHLRTNLLIAPESHSLKTLLVASPQTGDGKTFTTANLGAVMADGKSRIVMVDADLRNPYLHEVFGQPNLCGLADILSADESLLAQLLSEYLRNTNIPGLALLSAGRRPQDPSFLLSTPKMKILMEELSRRFDFVILDSPPYLAAPDANILSKFAQAILLVVYPGKTNLKAAEETVHSFSSNGSKVLGVVLNHTSLDHYPYHDYPRRKTVTSLPEKMSHFFSSVKPPLDPDLISMEEAANMLGVRVKTITGWCQEGQLQTKRVYWRQWVKRDELRDLLKNRFGVDLPVEKVIQNEEANLNPVVPAVKKNGLGR